MKKILIIQTAFIGDVVLATALVEKIALFHPDATIDFLVRKGNETLLLNNPHLSEVFVWNKKKNKFKSLSELLKKIRLANYDKVINVQRFFSSGLLTAFSGAKETIGFDKNPLSFLFSKKIKHLFDLSNPRHEVEKNNDLIAHFTDYNSIRPALYPSALDIEFIEPYIKNAFITITPSSVWFTKEYPKEKWIEFIHQLPAKYAVYLLGGKENMEACKTIIDKSNNKNIVTLAGKLSFLQSAALMKFAAMNYTNDSAPLHFASAVNASITAVFCSTLPAFGYTPLSDQSFIVQTKEVLSCRPCGIHGRKKCPEKHFNCAYTIETSSLLNTLNGMQ